MKIPILIKIADYLRMIKFAHTIFALPFAGIAFLLALKGTEHIGANGPAPSFYLLLLQITICMAALRSAAMGFNRWVDREIDAANPRTAGREIPAGKISALQAKIFISISIIIFIATSFWINFLCGILSPVAIALALGYSYSKRVTYLCHYILGLAIGIAPVGAWIAVRNEFALVPILWTVALNLYIAGFDILYSCQDQAFDRNQKLYSIPARFGIPTALFIARLTHVLAAAAFFYAGYVAGAGWIYMIAAGITGGLFILQHTMVRPGKLDAIPIAFFNVNAAISSILFAGLMLDYFLD